MSRPIKLSITLTSCLLMALAGTEVHAQNAAIDAYLERMAEMRKYTGTLLLGTDDKLVYEKAVGPATADGSTTNDEKSVYRIGSITKTFTAALVLMASEEDLLSLDDTLNQYVPEIQNADRITLRQMLNQTSGIGSYTSLPDMERWKQDFVSSAAMVEKISKIDPQFEPGMRYAYSNSNYYLLGLVLEQAYGRTYEDLLQEKIVKPVGMNYTGSTVPDKKANLVDGLTPTEQGWDKVEPVHLSIPYAAGAIHSNAFDLFSFSKALFGSKLFKSEESLRQMRTMENDSYGMGLFESQMGGEVAIGHNGGIDGYSSAWAYLPSLGLHVVSLSNCFVSDHQAVIDAAVRIYKGEDIKPPVARQAVFLPPDLLQTYAGAYSLDAGFLLNVSVQGKGLRCQVPRQDPISLLAESEQKFFSEIHNLELQFTLNASGDAVERIKLSQAGMDFTGSPFNLPDHMIKIAPEKLKRLEGTYELQKGFNINIFVQNEILMAQATGQSAFELLAEDETHFFAKVAPIEIQFELGDDSLAKAMVLKQSGQVLYAQRIVVQDDIPDSEEDSDTDGELDQD